MLLVVDIEGKVCYNSDSWKATRTEEQQMTARVTDITLTMCMHFIPSDMQNHWTDDANDLWIWEMDGGEYFTVSNRYTADRYDFPTFEKAQSKWVREWIRMRAMQNITLDIK